MAERELREGVWPKLWPMVRDCRTRAKSARQTPEAKPALFGLKAELEVNSLLPT